MRTVRKVRRIRRFRRFRRFRRVRSVSRVPSLPSLPLGGWGGSGGGGGGGGGGICCSLRVYFFANFSCLCSLRYAFQSHSKLFFPSRYTISRFFVRILCSLRAGVM